MGEDRPAAADRRSSVQWGTGRRLWPGRPAQSSTGCGPGRPVRTQTRGSRPRLPGGAAACADWARWCGFSRAAARARSPRRVGGRRPAAARSVFRSAACSVFRSAHWAPRWRCPAGRAAAPTGHSPGLARRGAAGNGRVGRAYGRRAGAVDRPEERSGPGLPADRARARAADPGVDRRDWAVGCVSGDPRRAGAGAAPAPVGATVRGRRPVRRGPQRRLGPRGPSGAVSRLGLSGGHGRRTAAIRDITGLAHPRRPGPAEGGGTAGGAKPARRRAPSAGRRPWLDRDPAGPRPAGRLGTGAGWRDHRRDRACRCRRRRERPVGGACCARRRP